MDQQLAEDMGRFGGGPHQEPPDRAELAIDIRTRSDPGVAQTGDQPVHSAVAGALGVRPLGDGGLETAVIDDEVHLGVVPGDGTDVHR